MKHKFIITSLLLLSLLLILTAVSAQDVDNNTLVEENNDILYSTDNNVHSFLKEDSNDPQTESQSFSELKDKITTDLSTGTTVDLSSNYKFNEDTDTVGSITISKANSVIDGNGITIDGSSKTAIFRITGIGVTLKNINFINGNNSTGQGGAIYSTGANLTIINCNFTNNTASSGGAIRITGANSIIDECIFINNSASSSFAGAIYSTANGDIINNSKFYNNSANNSNGGAIYKTGNLGAIDNCYFEENTASTVAGAVYAWSTGGYNITNSNFTRNKLLNSSSFGYGGGAIYGFGNIESCIFEGNSAISYGGAIFSKSTTMGTNVTNSQFINNTANNSGGAIYHYTERAYGLPITINSSTFRNNHAGDNTGGQGGAIYIYQNSINSTINNSLFINNSVTNIGGAVVLKSAVEISNSQFYNNTAYQSGAIRAENNTVFSNLTLIGNKATYRGSAIEMTGTYSHILYDSILLNNTAGSYTMELYTVRNADTAKITSVYRGNDNILNGILYRNESTLRIKNVTYWGVGGVLNTGNEEVTPVLGAENSQDGKLIYVDYYREAYINTTIVVIYNNGSSISTDNPVFKDANLWSNNTILSDETLFQNYEYDNGTDISTPFKNMKIIAQYTGPTNIYGNITLNLTDLEGGTYTAVTFHNEDEYYFPYYSKVGQFSIIKKDVQINITGENITVGEKEVLEVNLPKTVSGIVTVDVYNNSYPVYVYQGYGLLVVRDLPAGNYTANVTFNGNSEYAKASNTTNFTVSKLDADITVIDLENGTVAVVLPKNATGNISLSVDGEEYNANLTNGIAYVNLVNNTPGTYNVNVNYPGNEKYSSNTGTGTATIPKLNSSISVSVDPIFVGDDAIVQVSIPEDATGDITIGIDGVNYTNSSYVDGVAIFTIPGLKAGNKTIHVEYAGDDNYLTNFTSVDLEVKKRESSVSVSAVNSTVGNATVITVTVPEDATGQVLINVNNTPYYVNVTDGVGSVEVYGLTEGVYDISATYLGDDKYLNSTDNSNVSVSKVESFVSADVGNITVGDVALINITTPVNVTGNVTVKVTDKDGNVITKNVAVDNGFGQLAIPDLAVGNYTVDLDYNGDIAYKTSSNSTSFEVKKADIDDLNVNDLGNGTLKLDVLPGDATGNLTVTVDGKNFTGEIIDGIATINIDNINPGKHNITVNYPGDTKYNPFTKNDSVVIPKYDSPINVTVDSITVGEDAVIKVSIPENATGNITIGIDGKRYTNASYVDGVAIFTIPDLTEGNKTVIVEYAGDDNYLSNYTSTEFEVYKRYSKVVVDPVEGVTWDDVLFKARVTDHNGNPVSGGFVIFKVSGKTLKDSEGNNLKAYVDNGIATLTYQANSGWIVDYHPDVKVQAVYSGTNDVMGNRSDNNTVTIYKRNATVELSAPEDYVNGTLHIDAIVRDQNGTTVNDGYLVFKINGLVLKDENNKDVKARVSKYGTVHVDVQLPFNYKAKEYNLSAVYSHKVYYRAEGSNTTSLKVIPTYVNTTITIDDQFSKPVITGQIYNAFNDAVLAQNVTLTIKFDGISYVKRVTIVNGTFNETLEGVLPYMGSTHTVEVVSGATDHYESARQTYTVDATPKYNVTTVITNVSRNSTTTRVQANLLDDQNNNVQKDTKIVIKVNGKTFLYNETVTNGVVDVSFDTSSLSNKTYDLELISGANKYYNASSNTTKLPTY